MPTVPTTPEIVLQTDVNSVVDSTLVRVKGRLRVTTELRHTPQPVPGRTGDSLQTLGRKSRVFTVRGGTIYGPQNALPVDADDVSRIARVDGWVTNATTVYVTTPKVCNASGIGAQVPVKVVKFDWTEGPEKGFEVDLIMIQVD